MSIVKILNSQVVFMVSELKALVIPMYGIRIDLKYCSNQLVYGLDIRISLGVVSI